MKTPTLIRHESPSGPYWYHPDHPLCQDGKTLWDDHVKCEYCDGTGFAPVENRADNDPYERVKTLEETLARITEHYSVIRAELVDREAYELYGGFQAAANGKSLEMCRLIANARLRGKCSVCDGSGHDSENGECERCEGNGFLEIPEVPN